MDDMPMPGGETLSMMWMLMPGQTWLGAAASFLGMWAAMMVAMMLPSLVPALCRYRQTVGGADQSRVALPTVLAASGYFFVWIVPGVAVFPLGMALSALEMQRAELARAIPMAVGVVVVIAGALQFTTWKARSLTCLREAAGGASRLLVGHGTAFRHGVHLGLRCAKCCANLMAIPLVIGLMDLRAMALVAAAIALERLPPDGQRIARATGIFIVGAGLLLTVRAAEAP